MKKDVKKCSGLNIICPSEKYNLVMDFICRIVNIIVSLFLFGLIGFSLWIKDVELFRYSLFAIGVLIIGEIAIQRINNATEISVKIINDGIMVQYRNKKEKLLYWHEFKEIAIVYENSTRIHLRPARERICCVKLSGKKDGCGRWAYLNPWHCYNFVVFPYTKEYITLLEKYCPMEIVDLRNTDSYICLNYGYNKNGEDERIDKWTDYSFGKSNESLISEYIAEEYKHIVPCLGHQYFFKSHSEEMEKILPLLKTSLTPDNYTNCYEAYLLFHSSSETVDLSKFDNQFQSDD